MGRAKAITLIILIQFILLHVTKSQQGFEESLAARTLKQESHDTHEVHCSRERSRAAWQIIDDYLMPFVEEEGYQISADCRLHPDNDLFRDQERHKIHLDVNELRCGYCKKSFRAERFLDQHFDNRHYNLLNVNQSKCLADLCGALHCDFVINSNLLKAKCNPAAATRNRHLCESLANSCFPISPGPSARRLHEANKFTLHGYIDTTYDAASSFLSSLLFISKRYEARNPSAKTSVTSWTESKTFIVVRKMIKR
ncbi:hypothetical protein ES332_A07G063100v1 [Gossypium tomentosum]|uniref:C2H2-type domain-containing protein n=1 Tax=Gossypium tomentosum TaxID=34277 RepID=A0A5D2PNX3_GOSTO|nr:hypothetical protein ES332_A07G063100v1 [Gossypium tomentosum]